MSLKLPSALSKSSSDANAKRLPSLADTSGPSKPKLEKDPAIGDAIAGIPKRESPASANGKGGEFDLEIDPSKRPDLASFDRGRVGSMFDLLHPATGDRARSAAELRDAANSMSLFDSPADSRTGGDPTAGQDFAGDFGRAAPPEGGKFKNSPRTSQQMDGADSSGAAGGSDSAAKKTEEEEGEEKKEEKGVGETIIDGAKAVGSFLRDWATEVVFTKFGPPGPWTTPLTGPAALDGAGGDVGAIVDGAKTVGEMQDGDYFGKRLRDNGVYTPAPDSDGAPVNAGEAAANSRLSKLIAAMIGPVVERLRPTDKSQITQPGSEGFTRPQPTREELGFRPDPKAAPRTGQQVNPGTGDTDIVLGGINRNGPVPKRDPGFVDPPDMLGLDRPSVPDRGATPPSGGGDPDAD